MAKATETVVRLEDITKDTALQPRAALDTEAVSEYADAYKNKAKIPPVLLYKLNGDLLLISGWHRVCAREAGGFESINAEIIECESRSQAVMAAVSSNQTHGVRRTNSDKRRAVELALADPDVSQMSLRQIAALAGVSHQFVQNVKAGSTSADNIAPDEEDDKPEAEEGPKLEGEIKLARSVMQGWSSTIKAIINDVKKHAGEPGFEFVTETTLRRQLRAAADHVHAATPACPCPKGHSEATCPLCKGTGWITEGQKSTLEE